MKLDLEVRCAVVCAFALAVLSAPTNKEETKAATEKRSLSLPPIDSETDLQKLARLTANKLQNVDVQKQKIFSYSNVNGKEESISESEDKVINPENGKVVSDIKQKSEKDASSEVPLTETEVDIPAMGIHETYSSADKVDNIPNPDDVLDYDEAFRFTPSIVAEYLVQTGEFQQFEAALADLVNSSLMTPQQAETYKENVRLEYNRIVQENNAILANEALGNTLYPVSYDFPPLDEDVDVSLNPETEGDIYRLYGYTNIIPHLGIEELQSKEVMHEAINRASSLIELIKALMDEWLTRAIVTGDPDAEKLLGDILKEVSKDNDPDDLSQMRDILYEFFANEVLNSLQKRPGSDMSGLPVGQQLIPALVPPQSQALPEGNSANEVSQTKAEKSSDSAEEEQNAKEESNANMSKDIMADKMEDNLKHLKM